MLFIVLCAAAGVTFLAQATEARSTRPNRRDVWVPLNPQAFEVKLDFDKVGRYVTTIGMVSWGEPLQIAELLTIFTS